MKKKAAAWAKDNLTAIVLAALFIPVFIWTQNDEDAVKIIGTTSIRYLNKEFYRWFTCIFFHYSYDHIIFNSINQLEKHRAVCLENGVSMGLRINPECSTQEHGIYDPCAPFSRLGVTREMIDKALGDGKILRGVEGLHVHTLCEQNADALETTLKAFCNDNNGFAIYAAGYTGNEVGGTNSNKLVSCS